MRRQLSVILLLCLFAGAFSFKQTASGPAAPVKRFYLQCADSFRNDCSILLEQIKTGNEKKIRQQFLKARYSYKQIEVFTEYFFPFYAGKINGPPIPFFEESEPDKGEQPPEGMQVIESLIFPRINYREKGKLDTLASELLRYATELPTVN